LNKEIFINESKLPVLNEHNHYYWKDIIGCLVINCCGSTLGEVTSIIETGSNDVLVIKDKQSSRNKTLVPFLEGKVIKKVNISSRLIEVDWSIDY
jgi:16S rRNA processing protein RimM